MSEKIPTLSESISVALSGFFGQLDTVGHPINHGALVVGTPPTGHEYSVADTAAAKDGVDTNVAKTAARRAIFSGHAIQTGAPPPKPVASTISRFGAGYGTFGVAGGLLTLVESAHSTDPVQRAIGGAAGTLATAGGFLYGTGASVVSKLPAASASLMSAGSNAMHMAGGLGTILEANGVAHAIAEERVEDAVVGSLAGTGLALTTFTKTPVGPALVVGTLSYRLTMTGLNAVFGETHSLTADDLDLLKSKIMGD